MLGTFRSASRNLKNSMNVTESVAGSLVCPKNEMVWKQEYWGEKIAIATTAIILNILSFPVTILMNVLVIMAVKTRTRLQSKYNILLACLAGTDLLVGAASQPSFIAEQIYVIKGLSLMEYCRYHMETHYLFLIPLKASLFHLTLISIERFVAIKYTFRYITIVTGLRLKIAVVSSWVIASSSGILQRFSVEFETLKRVEVVFFGFFNFSLILYCHLAVYFETRRHEKQIKSQQVSPQAAADFAKEKKALKTTRIIITALLVCFFPLFVYILISLAFSKSGSYIVNAIMFSLPIVKSFFFINSLCNPIIYCYRSKMFRKTCKELLMMKCKNVNEE